MFVPTGLFRSCSSSRGHLFEISLTSNRIPPLWVGFLVLFPFYAAASFGNEPSDANVATAAAAAEGADESETESEGKASQSQTNEGSKSEAKSTHTKPKTHEVTRQPLKVETELDGVFVAGETEEVVLRPETWTKFKVVEAVAHGTRVHQGDVLIRFDDEAIEQKLAEESIGLRLEELALMELEEALPRKQRKLEIAYEEARLSHEQLLEDYQYYKKTDRPFSERLAKYRLDSSEEDLASQEEELAQLEKMYAADDLTEETEQIVLRRQRFQVATAQLYLELQRANHDYTLDVRLPRTDETYDQWLEDSKLSLQQAKTARDLGIIRGKYELEKKRQARAKRVASHAKLLGDRGLMVVRAPADGIVYNGRYANGKWPDISSLTDKLKPHATVTTNKVLMTIVKQRPLRIDAWVEEAELPDFKVGLPVTAVPTGDDELELEGKVTKVAAIPDGDLKFHVEIDVDLAEAPTWLVAGMNCEAKVKVYEKSDALVVPSKLVQTDEDDEKVKFVMVAEDKEKPTRREVKLGRTEGNMVEILEGLSEGDRVVEQEKSDESEED